MATARTVTELIQSSLRAIGKLAASEAVKAEDTATGLTVFQDLIADIGSEKMMIPGTTVEAVTLVAAQGSYTVGEEGTPDLDTVRPEHIFNAFIRDSSSDDHPVECISEYQYNAISSKDSPGRPDRIWYNPTAPNGTVYTYPTPSTIESLYIVSRKPFIESTTIADELLDTLGIPRNYHKPLKWMLAMELAPEYGIEPTNFMLRQAVKGEAKIMSLNAARRVHSVSLDIPMSQGSGGGTFYNS